MRQHGGGPCCISLCGKVLSDPSFEAWQKQQTTKKHNSINNKLTKNAFEAWREADRLHGRERHDPVGRQHHGPGPGRGRAPLVGATASSLFDDGAYVLIFDTKR